MSLIELDSKAIIENFEEGRNPASRLPRRVTRWSVSGWAALLFFMLTSAAFTWPLVTQLSDTLPDWGDAADSAWRIGSIAQQLRTDPLHLYQTTAFHPLSNGLALDELLTGQGLLTAPLIWLTGNPPLAYNLLIFGSYVLSGFAMWLLVRHLTGNSPAGLMAGVIYAFSPWHYGQYAHLGLSSQQWMVFALYFLMRFVEATRPGHPAPLLARRNLLNLGLFAFFLWLQSIVAGYYAYFGAILVGFYLFYYFGFSSGLLKWLWGRLRLNRKLSEPFPWQRLVRQAGLIAVAGMIAVALVVPFVLPFREAQAQFSFRRDLNEVSYWSAAPNSLLRTTPRSWLYKPVQYGIFKLQTSPERMLYPGLIAVLLGLGGLALNFKRRKENRRRSTGPWLFAGLSLTGLVLSFGPGLNLEAYGLNSTGITMPYKWFYDYLPGFDALRVPQRFGQLFMLGLAVCAGYGIAAFFPSGGKFRSSGLGPASRPYFRKPKFAIFNALFNFLYPLRPTRHLLRSAGLLLILGLVMADYFAPGLPTQPTPTGDSAPQLYRWLASREAEAVIPKEALLLELPISEEKSPVNTNPLYLMYGLSHGRPLLNGSANIIPTGYDLLFNEMQAFPNQATLDIAEGLGVQYLVVHTKGLGTDLRRAELEKLAEAGNRLELIKSFETSDKFKDVVYRLKSGRQRFQKLAALIPEGAEVLLAEHPAQRRLYNQTLPLLIGPNRRYFTANPSIYAGIAGNIQPARPNRVYDYAIFYRGTGSMPTEYGYSPSDLILNDEAYALQVYHKRPELVSFFSFQQKNRPPGSYLPFSAQSSVYLRVSEGTVRQISPKEATKVTSSSDTNQSLSLILATAEPRTVILRSGNQEKRLEMKPGFYRWRLSVDNPELLELRLEGSGWAYLIQARLYSTTLKDEEEISEPIKGAGGTIIEASSEQAETTPGVITSRLVCYTESRPAKMPTWFFQVNITAPHGPGRFLPPPPGLNPREKPNIRRFGEWAVALPPLPPGLSQTFELHLNLLEQKAQVTLNGQAVAPAISMPLSTAEGQYQADIALLQPRDNQPVLSSSLNREMTRVINSYYFQLARPGGQPTITDLRYDLPNALIILPSVEN